MKRSTQEQGVRVRVPTPNREKTPDGWGPDIDQSVAEYNDWYMREAPSMWVHARGQGVAEAADAMEVLDDLRDISPESLRSTPAALSVLRMATSPKIARDRFVEFAQVNKSLVTGMERNGVVSTRIDGVDEGLNRICEFLEPLIDPNLFPWIGEDRAPTADERDKALLVLGERRAGANFDPAFRNAQEARQKELMRSFLESHGFEESARPAFEMPSGTFAFGRNVPIPKDSGKDRNLPVDCVIAPRNASMPLACVEMKSAGDFTNVNKRRKEEAEKHDSLVAAYGERVVFLLQLFGYFNPGYLTFEAAAGIDWAWDHRLKDLAGYFGI